MIGDLKEVFYDKFCHKCVHEKLAENEEPCCDCLNEPGNVDSHRPIYFEQKGEKK